MPSPICEMCGKPIPDMDVPALRRAGYHVAIAPNGERFHFCPKHPRATVQQLGTTLIKIAGMRRQKACCPGPETAEA